MSIKIKGGGGDLVGSRTTKRSKKKAAKAADAKDVSASQKVSTINRLNHGDRQDVAFKEKVAKAPAPAKPTIKTKSKAIAKFEKGTSGIKIKAKKTK